MFTAIKINDNNYKFRKDSNSPFEAEINGLNKINIFVGQNNSGKSRFMRSIFSKEIFFKDDLAFPLDKWNVFITKIEALLNHFRQHGGDFHAIQTNIDQKTKDYLSSYQYINLLKGTYEAILNNVDSLITGGLRYQHKVDFKTKFDAEIRNIIKEEDFLVKLDDFSKKVYIPMLRGLKNPIPNEFKKDLYKERTYYDYFLTTKNKDQLALELDDNNRNIGFEIFTGLSLYEDVKAMLLGTHEKRENIKAFESFLSNNFFENKQITLTPNIEDDVLYVKIGKSGKDIPIYDLGDGIQSIIINAFPLFKYKDENLLLFIEEPEIGIHPGMQRILLNTFTKGVKNQKGNHQIFFTTHSNHFLDIALDKEINDKISIYQFKETDNINEKSITNISQNKEILDLLGVRNSSVFLSNCIIWVEGISDRLYIKKFLELYQRNLQNGGKKFEEDKHFSIIEYGGGNIVHFNFIQNLDDINVINILSVNKNNFIISDNDGKEYKGKILSTDDEKTIRLKKLKKSLKNYFYCEYREIENILGFEVLRDYLYSIDFSKKDITLNDNLLYCFNNKENYDSDCYQRYRAIKGNIDWSTSIGKILKDNFIEEKRGKKVKYFKKNHIECIGETKSEIANNITTNHLKFYLMTNESKKLAKKIYKFIEENNT